MRNSNNLPAAIGLDLMNNLTNKEGFVIGKANVRYTLWIYKYEEINSHKTLILNYLHNLSSDLNVIQMNWPEVYICENLRGSSWNINVSGCSNSNSTNTNKISKTLEDYDFLPFGKYSGKKFADIDDCSYWCYLANSDNTKYNNIDFKSVYVKRALECGAVIFNNRYYDPAYLNSKQWYQIYKEIEPKVKNHEPFSFVPYFNGNSFWFGMQIDFKEEDKYDFYNYYGGGHYLVTTNKKGQRINKRTKGKTIEVLDYNILNENDEINILVNKFNIK